MTRSPNVSMVKTGGFRLALRTSLPLLLLFGLIAAYVTQGRAQVADCSTLSPTPIYQTVELSFTANSVPTDPFGTYLLKLEITTPNNQTFVIDGFYDGDGNGGQTGNVWKARLAPNQPGCWRWRTVAGDNGVVDSGLANQSGMLNVVASPNGTTRGSVVADGRFFRYQNGERVYLVGNFLDFSNGLPSTHVYPSHLVSNQQRNEVFRRQLNFHNVNKVNLYIANRGDYSNLSVIPWVDANPNANTPMSIAHWRLFDSYVERFQTSGVLSELWFFADDSGFGAMDDATRLRLIRYAMARTSAYHTLYVLALEWQEGFSPDAVRAMGQYAQTVNPWQRLLSVHSLNNSNWDFAGEAWATFIATQRGNDASPEQVNAYARQMATHPQPHIDEEFGILDGDSDARLRGNLWANFLGGAAGSGTGSDLAAFRRFLDASQIPYWQMQPANDLVENGGSSRFTLADPRRHYAVYSQSGAFHLSVQGNGLTGYWFNPRNPRASLSPGFAVSPGDVLFTPPGSVNQDWVLWVTDNSHTENPQPTATLTPSNTPTPSRTPTPTPSPTTAPPGAPVLLAPTGNVIDTQPEFSWTVVTDATWYFFWLSRADGTRILSRWFEQANICSETNCSFTINQTLGAGIYRWWVQAWSPEGGYGPWSEEAHFRLPPPPPTLIAPLGEINETMPTYSWQVVEGATWYYLWISTMDGEHILDMWFSQTAVCSAGGCSVTPGITLSENTYRWWVRAWSPQDSFGEWSDEGNFSVVLVGGSGASSGDGITVTMDAPPTLTPEIAQTGVVLPSETPTATDEIIPTAITPETPTATLAPATATATATIPLIELDETPARP